VGAIEVDTRLAPVSGDSSAKTLYAAHDEYDVHPQRTLRKLYLDPLLALLDRNNASAAPGEPKSGVYKDDPRAEILLAIDVVSLGTILRGILD
jgi:hypothetical protein